MEKKWWNRSVVYQIYPRSFQDSNHDGIGDIQGIISRLDYLQELGIDIIWISPMYQSPMDDNGYDIADYYTIDAMFGTNDDFDQLLIEAEKHGIKIMMDLVVNHTSDEHSWFQEALNDHKSKYRDYYVFREGMAGNPPNNWRSYFGESTWEKVPREENMFYLHAFTKKQPDLNWENPQMRQEIYNMINFWLDKGVAGFRIDAILNIKKNIQSGLFEPDGEDGLVFIGPWILNQSGIELFLNELNQETFQRHNSVTVAEADVPINRLKEYIGEDGFFSMVFDFSYTDIDIPKTGEWYKQNDWTWQDMKENMFNSQLITQKNGWGAVYLENHDPPRSISKYIPEEYRTPYSKKMLATLFMMLRGTPFIYQGQELGMSNIAMDTISDYDDIATYDQYHRAMQDGLSHEQALAAMNLRSRDNSRTPMQWDNSKNAGFSDADQTWFKVNPNYTEINALAEMQDPQSVFNFYRSLIDLGKNSRYKDIVVFGEFVPVEEANENTIVYKRAIDNKAILVAINPSPQEQTIQVEEEFAEMLINNYETPNPIKAGSYLLCPYESIIIANH